jgi:hypothetical protein
MGTDPVVVVAEPIQLVLELLVGPQSEGRGAT